MKRWPRKGVSVSHRDDRLVHEYIPVPSLGEASPNQLVVALVGFGISVISILGTLASPIFLDGGLPTIWRWMIGIALILGVFLVLCSVILQAVVPRWRRMMAYSEIHARLEQVNSNLSYRLENAALAVSRLTDYRQSVLVFELRSPTVTDGELIFVLDDRSTGAGRFPQPRDPLIAIDLGRGQEFGVLEVMNRRSSRGQSLVRVVEGDPVWLAFVQDVALTGQEYRTEIVAVMTIESVEREA